jgi:hypothetical protein
VNENTGNIPNDGIICNGDNVQLIASGGLEYHWSPSGSPNSSIINVTPTSSTIYTVTVTYNNLCPTISTQLIVVNPLPNDSISGSDTVCQNSAQPAIALHGYNGLAPYQFTYKINQGLLMITNPPSFNNYIVNASTTYSGVDSFILIKISDANQCSSNFTDTAIILVNPQPVGTISGGNTFCSQNATTTPIDFSADSASAPYTFYYHINVGPEIPITPILTNDTSLLASLATQGNYLYTIDSISDNKGCSNSQSHSTLIIVNQSPISQPILVNENFGNIDDDGIICFGDQVTLNAGGGFEYHWSPGSFPDSSSIVVSPSSTTVYTVTVTLNNLCPMSTTTQIIINPLPDASITGPSTLCQFQIDTIYLYGINGILPYTFNYSFNGDTNVEVTTLVYSDTTLLFDAITIGNNTYSINWIKDSNQCKYTPSPAQGLLQIDVREAPEKPVFSAGFALKAISGLNDTLVLCKGSENINFNILSAPEGNNYLWNSSSSSDSILIKDSLNPNTLISFQEPGFFIIHCMASSNQACTSQDSLYVVVNTNINSIQNRNIILKQPGNLLIYPDNSMDSSLPYIDSLNGIFTTFNGYQWGYDSIISQDSLGEPHLIKDQVYQVFIPDNKFIYNKQLDTTRYAFWVALKNKDCVTKIYYNGPYANKSSSTSFQNPDVLINAYPNPNQGDFTINIQGKIYGKIDISLYNSLGLRVYHTPIIKTEFDTDYQLHLPQLPEGVYLLKLYNANHEQYLVKIIINH